MVTRRDKYKRYYSMLLLVRKKKCEMDNNDDDEDNTIKFVDCVYVCVHIQLISGKLLHQMIDSMIHSIHRLRPLQADAHRCVP